MFKQIAILITTIFAIGILLPIVGAVLAEQDALARVAIAGSILALVILAVSPVVILRLSQRYA